MCIIGNEQNACILTRFLEPDARREAAYFLCASVCICYFEILRFAQDDKSVFLRLFEILRFAQNDRDFSLGQAAKNESLLSLPPYALCVRKSLCGIRV